MFRSPAFALSLAVALATSPLAAQEAASPIEDTIASQLEAFNARDVGKAWTYASPMIQGMFGNPATFGMMVERGYPMVWSNESVQFLDQRSEGGAVYQRLSLRDAAGGRHWLEYKMIETQGGWRIDGVWLLPAPDLGV